MRIIPHGYNLTSQLCRWRWGSKAAVEVGSRFDLRKNEKNATKHAAQKVASIDELRFKTASIL